MKSPQETLAHLEEVLAHIYLRPEMYAATPSELDGVLYQYHRLWGFISERDDEVTSAHANLVVEDYGGAVSPEWFYDRIQLPDTKAFSSTLNHWRKVDATLQISLNESLDPDIMKSNSSGGNS